MNHEDELAPEPEETFTIRRAANGHGWSIIDDGKLIACFSTVADMGSWMNTHLGRLDEEAGIIPRKSGPVHALAEPVDEPIPIMFTREEEPPKPALIWRVFAGGRR